MKIVLIFLIFILSIEARSKNVEESDECSASSSEEAQKPKHHHHKHQHKHHKKRRTTTTTTTTPAPPKCSEGWTGFQRSGRTWCIQVFDSLVNHMHADAHCRMLRGSLTGIESVEENRFIQAEGLRCLQKYGKTLGAIWLGLERRPECQGFWNSISAACSGSNGFVWMDGVTTRKDTMTWRPTMPDNSGGNQNCAYMHVGYQSFLGINPGTLDDIECLNPVTANLDIQIPRGFACGKWAE